MTFVMLVFVILTYGLNKDTMQLNERSVNLSEEATRLSEEALKIISQSPIILFQEGYTEPIKGHEVTQRCLKRDCYFGDDKNITKSQDFSEQPYLVSLIGIINNGKRAHDLIVSFECDEGIDFYGIISQYEADYSVESVGYNSARIIIPSLDNTKLASFEILHGVHDITKIIFCDVDFISNEEILPQESRFMLSIK
jgi:hypothetical protein